MRWFRPRIPDGPDPFRDTAGALAMQIRHAFNVTPRAQVVARGRDGKKRLLRVIPARLVISQRDTEMRMRRLEESL